LSFERGSNFLAVQIVGILDTMVAVPAWADDCKQYGSNLESLADDVDKILTGLKRLNVLEDLTSSKASDQSLSDSARMPR
jgi:hypothetical protein